MYFCFLVFTNLREESCNCRKRYAFFLTTESDSLIGHCCLL